MPGDLRTRCFYADVLYARSLKQSGIPLLEQNNPWNTNIRDRKFSFVYVNEQFMKTVKLMEEVVLVPTRLLDIEVKGESSIPDLICAGSGSSNAGSSQKHETAIRNENNNGGGGGSGVGSSGSGSNLYEVFHLLKKIRDKMQAMAITSEDEITSPSHCFEVEDLLCSFVPKVIDCDSGLWSLSSSASRESIDACLDSCSSSLDEHSSHSSDSDSLDSTYVVKKSLLSAKSLCTFLSEMTGVAQVLITRYLQEMQCDLCE